MYAVAVGNEDAIKADAMQLRARYPRITFDVA